MIAETQSYIFRWSSRYRRRRAHLKLPHFKRCKASILPWSTSTVDHQQQALCSWPRIRSFFVLINAVCLFQRKIDTVKIDIESDKWICLRHMLADGTFRSHVRQLDVEYHVIMTLSNPLREYHSTVKWLERQGFRIFHSRRNPYCSECWEMSYINTNLVDLPLNWEFWIVRRPGTEWGVSLR